MKKQDLESLYSGNSNSAIDSNEKLSFDIDRNIIESNPVTPNKIIDDFFKDFPVEEAEVDFSDSNTIDVLTHNKKEEISKNLILSEGTIIKGWQLCENISSKVVEFYDNVVLLELLIDRENQIFEEREFESYLFEGYNLEIGKVFKICTYRRNNQAMIEVKDNPKLILETDFPQIKFEEKFSNLILKKKLSD